jgi:SET domain-containing protein
MRYRQLAQVGDFFCLHFTYLMLGTFFTQSAYDNLAMVRSKIHGWGILAKKRFEKGEMVIECVIIIFVLFCFHNQVSNLSVARYIGELVRRHVSDAREKYYDQKGIGCYMFAIQKTPFVIDATMTGNAARFINHSCEVFLGVFFSSGATL